jgi:hypothetical protein
LLVDESHAGIVAVLQVVEDIAVEDEQGQDRNIALKGPEEAVVVVQAQIAPMPENAEGAQSSN